MNQQWEPSDVGQVGADDALLTELGNGPLLADQLDPDLALLASWRHELDSAATALPPWGDATQPGPSWPGPNLRSHRRTAAISGVLALTLLGMTGTAAALSGNHGPLAPVHRVLFGDNPHTHAPDDLALRATSLLDRASTQIDAGLLAGGLLPAERATTVRDLDAADRLILQDRQAPTALRDRAADLRRKLNALPTLPTLPTLVPKHPAVPVPQPQSTATPDDSGNNKGNPGEPSDGPTPPPIDEPSPEATSGTGQDSPSGGDQPTISDTSVPLDSDQTTKTSDQTSSDQTSIGGDTETATTDGALA